MGGVIAGLQSVNELLQRRDACREFLARDVRHLRNEHRVHQVDHVFAELVALSRQFEPDDPPVLGVRLSRDQPGVDQPVDLERDRARDRIEIFRQQARAIEAGMLTLRDSDFNCRSTARWASEMISSISLTSASSRSSRRTLGAAGSPDDALREAPLLRSCLT
jgi:hypothetical protein